MQRLEPELPPMLIVFSELLGVQQIPAEHKLWPHQEELVAAMKDDPLAFVDFFGEIYATP